MIEAEDTHVSDIQKRQQELIADYYRLVRIVTEGTDKKNPIDLQISLQRLESARSALMAIAFRPVQPVEELH